MMTKKVIFSLYQIWRGSEIFMKNLSDVLTILYDCPFCEEQHEIEIRDRIGTGVIKGEVVESYEKYYYCPVTDSEFVPAFLMDRNLLSFCDAYRMKHLLLTSKEIASIREKYSMTQKDFSLALGFGEITITRYETKQIQERLYDDSIRQAGEDPSFLQSQLDKNHTAFTPEKYEVLKKSIRSQLEKMTWEKQYLDLFLKKYSLFEEPSEYNGNKKIDINKVFAMISYFVVKIPHIAKVKLMKLMWYSDVLSFLKYSQSISGLVYSHMPYGAYPIGADDLLQVSPVLIEEVEYPNGLTIFFKADPKVSYRDIWVNLSEQEKAILETVKSVLGNYSGPQLSEIMHKEDAYTLSKDRNVISYELSKELKAFSRQ